MTKRKNAGGDSAAIPDVDESPEVTLGGDAPAEPFSERTDEPQYTAEPPTVAEREAEQLDPAHQLAALEAKARLQDKGLIPKTDPAPTSALAAPLPWWTVEAVCPTPVEPRVLTMQAESAQEAEATYRRASGLTGMINGGLQIRTASQAEIEATQAE